MGRLATLIVTLLFALAGLALGIWTLAGATERPTVAADFTRVGGPTRVETAIEASRFWLRQPQHIVTTSHKESRDIILGAATCAVVMDAPLLFRRDQPKPRGSLPEVISVRDAADVADCLTRADGDPSNADGLSVLDVRSRPAQPLEAELHRTLQGFRGRSQSEVPGTVRSRADEDLAPVVVFAAAKTRIDAPDVAVGLALAAHLASAAREVSLVVVPRYLQADVELETQLRNRPELVESGILLGQTGVLSEDTRALLRQIVVASDRQPFFAALEQTLGSLQGVLGALIAFLGAAGVVAAAPAIKREVVELFQSEPVRSSKNGGTGMVSNVMARLVGDSPGVLWLTGLDKKQVTVWLRSGSTVTGTVAGGPGHAERPSKSVLELAQEPTLWGSDGAERTAKTVRIALDAIELLAVELEEAATVPSPSIRRASLRVVAEIVAALTDGSLPPEDDLMWAIEATPAGEDLKRPILGDREEEILPDLRRLVDDARVTHDFELYAALRAVEDCLRLAERREGDPVARQLLVEALTEATRVGAAPADGGI